MLERCHRALALLEQDLFHPSLRLHPLEGRLAAWHSAGISLQYRITLELEVREQRILPVSAGSQSEAY